MNNHRFDLFISYSSKDKKIVHAIAGGLRAMGLRVFLDVWEIKLFSRVVDQLQNAIESARSCIIFYSIHAKQSPWVGAEP
jgi:hypothetical protein